MKTIQILSCLLFLHGCSSIKIDSIKIYYSSEEFTSVTPVRCGDLTYIANEWIDSLSVSNTDFLKLLDSEVSKLIPVEDSSRQLMPRLDTRIETKIFYKNSTKLLCLDKTGDIVFNDSTMKESKSLINLILSKIPKHENSFSN